MEYGTRAWLEAQYEAAPGDPWGLDWRPSQQYRYAHMVTALEQATASTWQARRVIDVGCATGDFTALLSTIPAAADASITGIDIAESAVMRARSRFPHLQFERMAIAHCAEKFTSSADLVTCLEVLYYLPSEERPAAIRDLCSLLRPGGMLLVSSMISRAPYFSPDELKALVEKELPVVHAGTLYLKPQVLWEKLRMRLGGSSHGSRRTPVDVAKVERIAAWSQRLLGERAQSHAFVVARLD